MRKRRPWSELEIALLREAYPDYMTEAIAAVLDRPIGQVHSKAWNLGLKKSAVFLASDASGRLQKLSQKGRAFRFEPGHVPANKGTRRPGYAPGRMAETQFKKGSMSGAAQHNYVPIGTLRVNRDGQLVRKITDDPDLYPARRWVPVTRLIWEATHGQIPAGYVVRFLPGMRTVIEAEITVDRLECISLAESMRRNSIHRYPKEIKDAIRSVAVLNRRINRVQKHQ
jgi:hypothetical protein